MIARLLCCSDTHDEVPPETDESGIVAWLHAGDCRNGWRKDFDAERHLPDESGEEWPTRKDAAIAKWYRDRTLPTLLVRGNHDTEDTYHALENSTEITGRVVEIAPHVFVAGIGWTGLMFADLPGESELQPVCDAVRKQVRRLVMPSDVLILLTHYPAEIPGLFRRVTFKGHHCIRTLIDELEPVVVIQGHLHEWFQTKAFYERASGKSLILNPGPGGAEIGIDTASNSVTVTKWLSH